MGLPVGATYGSAPAGRLSNCPSNEVSGLKFETMKPVAAKFATFDEAEKATRNFYRSLTPEERLEILFQLREMTLEDSDAPSGRLARVYRITELKRR